MIHEHGCCYHQHNCCPMGGEHCKHYCSCCHVEYCCKCGKEFGCGYGRYLPSYPIYPTWPTYPYITCQMQDGGGSGGAASSAKSTCTHSHI